MEEILAMIKEKMILEKVWAIVGASDNKEKFGYKIFKFMKSNGFTVYPVNPGVAEIEGQKCYASLKEIPEKPGAVDFVVPPKVGKRILHDCAALGIENIWLQPGADTDDVVAEAVNLGLNVVHNACVMVEVRKKGGA